MTILVGKYEFEGPFSTPDDLKNDQGVFAVHVRKKKRYRIIDVGESRTVKSSVEANLRIGAWDQAGEEVFFSAYYTVNKFDQVRVNIADEIRSEYNLEAQSTSDKENS